MCGAAIAAPKRVLLLHSYGRDFSPWAEISRGFRAELERQSPEPIEFHDIALATERFGAGRDEGPFVDYLLALFVKHRPDLIVAIGAPAARFVQERRNQLFPETPMLFTAVDQRRVSPSALAANDVVVANWSDFGGIIKNILQVLPETTGIAVVVGNSPVERNWLEQIRNAVEPFTNRVAFTWFNTLSLGEILKRAAALPPKSAIFYFQLSVDAAGVSHEQAKALSSLLTVANAPIFTHHDAKFGEGIVGGPLLSVKDVAQQSAGVAVRVLSGEAGIKQPPIEHGTPKFDWRAMQRWNIAESRLPPGSEVHFREPTAWEQYHRQIMLIATVLLIQTTLIIWLIYERRYRRKAEGVYRSTLRELANMNRIATAGEMSASIAHEVNQPLAAIVANANAGVRWLANKTPNLDEARAALERVARDGHRAAEAVGSVRAMYKPDGESKAWFDLNKLIQDVLALLHVELLAQGIVVQTELSRPLPTVLVNRGQLQQVILNLVRNAADAMGAVLDRARVLTVKTTIHDPDRILMSVEDSGTGIDPKDINKIFESFFTTKSQGMGLGLSICRKIVEAHGGQLTVEPHQPHGSVFQLVLPIALGGSG